MPLVFASLFLMAASLTMGIHLSLFAEAEQFVAANPAQAALRVAVVRNMVLAGIVAISAAAVFFHRERDRGAAEWLQRFATIASPTLLAFSIPFFFDWKVFEGRDLLFGACAVLFGVCLERLLRVSFAAARVAETPAAASSGRAWLPLTVVAALFAFFAIYFSFHSVQQHYNLKTQSFDLAIFDNLIWNLARGEWFLSTPAMGPTGSHLQRHATFLAYLFVPFHFLREKADVLLVLQAVIAGSGANELNTTFSSQPGHHVG